MRKLLVLWLGLAGCAPMTVHMDYDPDVDFARYATFGWMPVLEKQEGDVNLARPFLEKRIKKAILENMVAAGYERVATDPDLLVAYHIT